MRPIRSHGPQAGGAQVRVEHMLWHAACGPSTPPCLARAWYTVGECSGGGWRAGGGCVVCPPGGQQGAGLKLAVDHVGGQQLPRGLPKVYRASGAQ